MKHGFLKALDKLKRLLAEAEAALEARKKPPEETGPRVAGEGLVIDEWVRHINHVFFSHFGLAYVGITLPQFILSHSHSFFLCRKKEEKDTWPGSRLKW